MKLAAMLLLPALLGPGAMNGFSAAYSYSGPISGYTEVDLSPDGGTGNGGCSVQFSTLTDTLTYDSVNQTLQEQGTLTVTTPTVSFNIYSQPFFSTPGFGSVTATVGNDGTFAFDESLSPAGNGLFDGRLEIPVTGTGVYDGQPFAGSWDIDIPFYTQIDAVSSTSLAFSDETFQQAEQARSGVGGLADGTSDGTYYFSLNTGPLTATAAVSDTTNSCLLLGLGLLALAFFRPCWREARSLP